MIVPYRPIEQVFLFLRLLFPGREIIEMVILLYLLVRWNFMFLLFGIFEVILVMNFPVSFLWSVMVILSVFDKVRLTLSVDQLVVRLLGCLD
jgi:hypothetical protein